MEANKKHRTREEMVSLLNSWEVSGLTKQAFCQQHNLAYNVFHYWNRKIKASDQENTDSGFIEIKTTRQISDFEVLFPSGCIIRFSSSVDPFFIRKLIF
jgi:hypothetical protein